MSKPRDERQNDLFRPPLDAPPVRLAGEIDWEFLSGPFSSVCTAGAGQPPLPTR
jgi:IS5 family transposase